MRGNPKEFPPVKFLWPALFIGVAMIAAVDEILFHQVLGWHHFYDRATPMIGLMSDGFLHAAELLLFVVGFFGFWSLWKRRLVFPLWLWGGFFLGAGFFQVFDGIIDHKVLRLHQIRYGVYIVPYDIAWNVFGAMLILIGVWLAFRARKKWPDVQTSLGTHP